MRTWSERSLKAYNTLDPRLQRLMDELLKRMDVVLLEGHRNQVDQDRAVAEGKSKLKWPKGNHNSLPSKAVDVAPYPVDFKDVKRFSYMAGLCVGLAASLGIKARSGIDWDQDGIPWEQANWEVDAPHIEISD